MDEVGRGCLAGPVTAAAVLLPDTICFEENPWLSEVSDSKKLTALKRERLAPLISCWARAVAIGTASVQEIDQINIARASLLAMERAVFGLLHESDGSSPESILPDHVLVDGQFLPAKLESRATAVIRGDGRCLSIACASIVAKVWRDQHMNELEISYPGYGFSIHKGYPTVLHLNALKDLGVSPIHRRSFRPVAELL